MIDTEISKGWYLHDILSLTFVKPEIVDADTLTREELVEWVKTKCASIDEHEEREVYC